MVRSAVLTMPFTQRYSIIAKYLKKGTKRRPGIRIHPGVKFVVAHDTGNPNSTAAANVTYYSNTADKIEQSAHIFVDDKHIIECIPALTGPAEKAWHVRSDIPEDNRRYGANANDTAIAVEYCYGPNINATEAYQRYVWVLAYLCYVFQLPSKGMIVAHSTLDPGHRSDPTNGLSKSGRSFMQLLEDVDLEYQICSKLKQEFMKLVRTPTANKVYAIGRDGKKHWILDEATFIHGREMGVWGEWSEVETVGDTQYTDGYTIRIQ